MRISLSILAILFIGGCSKSVIDTADSMIGLEENKDRNELKEFLKVDPVDTPWCAVFVNAVLAEHGIEGSENRKLAKSFLNWGEEVTLPKEGDIVVFPRGNLTWQGHVGFYSHSVIRDGKEYYVILGGNQDNTVSYDYYPADEAIGIRRYQLSFANFAK